MVGEYDVSIVFEGRRGRLGYLWIPNDDGFVYVIQGGGFLRSGQNADDPFGECIADCVRAT